MEEKEHFQFRVSQIAALALILSIVASVVALIDFVGLSPYQSEIDRKISQIETAGTDIEIVRSAVANALARERKAEKQARLLEEIASLAKDPEALEQIKGTIAAAAPGEQAASASSN